MTEGLPELVLVGVESSVAELEVAFEFSDGNPQSAASDHEALMRTFVVPGEHGGYPSPGSSPIESQLSLIAGPRLSGRDMFFELSASHVDPRGFQLLRNMTGRLDPQKAIIARIIVREKDQETRRRVTVEEPDDYNEDEVYPEPSNQMTFEVDWVNTEFSKSRQCYVELRRPADPAQVAEISTVVKWWGDLLEAGAFAMPVGLPDEVESYLGSVSQFDETTVVVEVALYQASETAWNVLLNLLDVCSRAVPVARVIVE